MGGLLEALRRPRVLGMALFDWAASLLAGWAVGRYGVGVRGAWPMASWLAFWVALGVAVHVALGVPTQLGFYLGLNGPVEKNEASV